MTRDCCVDSHVQRVVQLPERRAQCGAAVLAGTSAEPASAAKHGCSSIHSHSGLGFVSVTIQCNLQCCKAGLEVLEVWDCLGSSRVLVRPQPGTVQEGSRGPLGTVYENPKMSSLSPCPGGMPRRLKPRLVFAERFEFKRSL